MALGVSERVRELPLADGVTGIELTNDAIAATVIPSQGALIYALEHRATGVDVLYKAPWGVRDPATLPLTAGPLVAWLDRYPGGWPVLFPSGAGPSAHRGVEHGYHGEASVTAWSCELVEDAAGAELRLHTRLSHSPFELERVVRLDDGVPVLRVEERVTNRGGHSYEYTWTHHPTFGGPFIDTPCTIDTDATTIAIGDERGAWPQAPGGLDLAVVPGAGSQRGMLGYLEGFERGWYAIANPQLGVGCAIAWPVDVLPYAWMFEELEATDGYPWHGRERLVAIEPSNTSPPQGLGEAVASGVHRVLEADESAELTITACLFEATGERVTAVGQDGQPA